MFKKPSSANKSNLSQYGLLDIDVDDVDDEPLDLSDGDVDLEAELAALSGDGGGRQKQSKPPKSTTALGANFDAMVAASLQDVPSDDDESGDEDDPELLSELKKLALDDEAPPAPPPRVGRPAPPPPGCAESPMVTLLQDRISNYTLAEKNAKANGESSRARRFGRGLKTLNDLLKQAKAGRAIKDEDIPPPVSLGKSAPQPPAPQPPAQVPVEEEPAPSAPEPQPTAPLPEEEPPSLPEPVGPPPVLSEESDTPNIDPEKAKGLQLILKRKEEFKTAALSFKHSGDKEMAIELLKVSKQFDMVVEAYRADQDMDLNELPTPQSIEAAFRSQGKEENQTQSSGAEPQVPTPAADSEGLIVCSTLEEGLKLRLAAFQKQEAKAKEDGNSSKARRMARIVKQYQEALRLHAAGKPVPVDELPAPLGHGPLPAADGAASPPKAPRRAPPAAPTPTASSSRHDKQLALLIHKQNQFREAAIRAKKAGNIEQAREYLRAAKGFDSVIEAARGGLVIDLKSLPLPPRAKSQLENSYDIVSAEDCGPTDDAPTTITVDDDDVLGRLQSQLASQLKLCLANRDHNQAMGQIAEANRFDHLAVTVQQDLDVVAVAKKLGRNPPKFHYESRQFNVVQCNTDLNENDLELTIVRGIAYNVPNPKEVDTYVKFEFPYPQEAPVTDRTAVVKDTNSPEYNAVFPLVINRSARPCQRVFKRHAIKLEVVSRGGWFRSDAALGTVTVKLAPLEEQITLHDSFPLMDGRRAAGGSLEVKLRVRTPLLHPQAVRSSHRWLVIDH